jgi:hypothetical protein
MTLLKQKLRERVFRSFQRWYAETTIVSRISCLWYGTDIYQNIRLQNILFTR